MDMTCGCADLIVSWWVEMPDGTQMLYIDDDAVPLVCPAVFGGDFVVLAYAAEGAVR